MQKDLTIESERVRFCFLYKTEDGEGQKVMKLHFATEDESVLQRWKTMIEQAIHVAPSTVSVIVCVHVYIMTDLLGQNL